MAVERLCHGAAPFLLLWWDDSLQLCGGRSFLCIWAILHGYCASAGGSLANLWQKDLDCAHSE